MKNSGKCPKCGSEKIELAAVYGNNIRLGVTQMSAVDATQYICCECGYSEQWINRRSLFQIRNHYDKKNQSNKE